jgi:hypothetical protein
MQSALRTVERRCAIETTVRLPAAASPPCCSASIVFCTSFSDALSSADVA